MGLTLAPGQSERFYLGLKDLRGILVPVGQGEGIQVTCLDKRVAIKLDEHTLQNPEASAFQVAVSGVVSLSTEPLPAVPPVAEKPIPDNKKPYSEWTFEEKEEHHRRARAKEDAKFPNRSIAPGLAPIVVTASYKGPTGTSSITDTVTPGGRTSGQLFGGKNVLVIPPAVSKAGAATAKPTIVLGRK